MRLNFQRVDNTYEINNGLLMRLFFSRRDAKYRRVFLLFLCVALRLCMRFIFAQSPLLTAHS